MTKEQEKLFAEHVRLAGECAKEAREMFDKNITFAVDLLIDSQTHTCAALQILSEAKR